MTWVTVFSEDRLVRDANGRPASSNTEAVDGSWRRGVDFTEKVRWAVRVAPECHPSAQRVSGTVLVLPDYRGWQILGTFPALFIAIGRAVRHSRLVVIRLPGALGLCAAFWAFLLRKPVAVEVVGDIGAVLQVGTLGRWGSRLRPAAVWLTRWAVRRARLVRYVTDSQLQLAYPPAPGAETVAFTDVNLSGFTSGRPTAASRDEQTILAVGSQAQRYKQHDCLIRATARLASEYPQLRLILVGDGRYQEELGALAIELGVGDRVDFPGRLPHSDVFKLMSMATVFAMPSLTEGLPRALIEAMWTAAPCVATAVGGIPELLEEADLVPVGDQYQLERRIAAYLADAKAAAVSGARNRERCTQLVASQQAGRERWSALLQRLWLADAGSE